MYSFTKNPVFKKNQNFRSSTGEPVEIGVFAGLVSEK